MLHGMGQVGESVEGVKNGGLNIASLLVANLGLAGKWWWRFYRENDAFWVIIVKSIHGDKGG